MNRVFFTIPGPPQGKARPKVVRAKSGISLTYTPDKTVAYEELVRLRYKAAIETACFSETSALRMRIKAYYQIPKSAGKKKQEEMRAGLIRPTKKPDCDNVAKIICDALNGVAYRDDAQIVELYLGKLYSADSPRVDVEITEVGA